MRRNHLLTEKSPWSPPLHPWGVHPVHWPAYFIYHVDVFVRLGPSSLVPSTLYGIWEPEVSVGHSVGVQ